jgi:hypothetical protein
LNPPEPEATNGGDTAIEQEHGAGAPLLPPGPRWLCLLSNVANIGSPTCPFDSVFAILSGLGLFANGIHGTSDSPEAGAHYAFGATIENRESNPDLHRLVRDHFERLFAPLHAPTYRHFMHVGQDAREQWALGMETFDFLDAPIADLQRAVGSPDSGLVAEMPGPWPIG